MRHGCQKFPFSKYFPTLFSFFVNIHLILDLYYSFRQDLCVKRDKKIHIVETSPRTITK